MGSRELVMELGSCLSAGSDNPDNLRRLLIIARTPGSVHGFYLLFPFALSLFQLGIVPEDSLLVERQPPR